MSGSPQNLARLLELEDDAELIAFACPRTDIPIWTSLRQPVLRLFGAGTFYEKNFISNDYRLLADPRDKMLALLRTASHNMRWLPSWAGQGEIAVSASGAGLIRRAGKFYNRLSDYMLEAAPGRSVGIEDLFDWRWPFPRENERLLFRTPIQAKVAFRGRLLERRQRGQASAIVALLARRLDRTLGISIEPSLQNWLTSLAARWLATAPYEVAAYTRLFGRLGTRLLLKEEGCYGHAATMIVAARQMGIVTAEYQHGLVSRNHDAYNFAEALRRSSAYRRTLPDYFLSYGRWWEDQINAPLTKVTIGNPHRSTSLREWKPSARTDVLVLGEGVDRDFYLGFCRQLASAIPSGTRVLFRPHPLERQHFANKDVRSKWSGISLDTNDDIYTSFRTARAVVGESSTALFEAAGLVDQIFVLDSAKSRFSVPNHPFAKFCDIADLQAQLDSGPKRQDQASDDDIWAPDWQERYIAFLQSVCR